MELSTTAQIVIYIVAAFVFLFILYLVIKWAVTSGIIAARKEMKVIDQWEKQNRPH